MPSRSYTCCCAITVIINVAHTGVWHTHRHGVKEKITMECNMDTLGIIWKVGHESRELDWSWGGFQNTFTLAGGDNKKIIRWRPNVRHPRFDDDHVVWVPHNSKHKIVLDMDYIVYTREKRLLKYFKDMDPVDWCAHSQRTM